MSILRRFDVDNKPFTKRRIKNDVENDALRSTLLSTFLERRFKNDNLIDVQATFENDALITMS